jgi:hypothetical protein
MRKTLLVISFCFLASLVVAQQETVINGRVLEKGKPEPLPFVSVQFKGNKAGTTTNFDGYFTLRTNVAVDSLIVSYIGYKTKRIKVQRGKVQKLIIELETDAHEFREVVIKPGINPALRIIRNAQRNREKYDQSQLTSFEYDCYSKVDVSMNNVSEEMKNNPVFRPLRTLFDTVNQLKNEDGKYILPLVVTEVHSRYYAHNNPDQNKEVIIASNQKGFGINQGSYVADLLGASTLQFNFNQNWIRILGKDFISPIATGGNSYYIYTLVDSMDIDGMKCYKIKLNLRREEDLGFLGTIWITDSTFALKQLQLQISPSANINFIDRLKIQQEMLPTDAGPWLPSKTRMIFDVAQLTKNSSGFIAKMYRANENIVVNKPKPPSFFDITIDKEDQLTEAGDAYWDTVRTEPFSNVEKQMINMIDSVQNVPVVKTYIDIVRIITEGFYRKGKIDYGPYVFFIGYNEVERLRFRVGFRTNFFFSKRWTYQGYLAYGTNDGRFKYGVGAEYLVSRRKWTSLSFFHKDDYDILGITDLNNNQLQRNNAASNVFAAINLGARMARINRSIDYRINFMSQLSRDWSYRIGFNRSYFQPIGVFVFAYLKNPEQPETPDNLAENFTTASAIGELRWAYKENMVVRNNRRIRLARSRWPEFTFTYIQGIKGLLGGEFDYRKTQLNITHHVTTGFLGNADYSITVGKIFGQLPYPLLQVPRGNPIFFYNDVNFSLMNLYEFVADEYTEFIYVQHFEGLFTNRIPVINKWKLRNFAVVKAAYGHLTEADKALLPESNVNRNGRVLSPVNEYKNEPYVEVGYGFENIFRLFSLSSIHRLTYLNNQNVRRWGINVGLKVDF